MDRNDYWKKEGKSVKKVALLAEGVDRNKSTAEIIAYNKQSPSSRRAWIEIKTGKIDRYDESKSPSSRRAWIEIAPTTSSRSGKKVALLAEGVDRNRLAGAYFGYPRCRPPRGGRG